MTGPRTLRELSHADSQALFAITQQAAQRAARSLSLLLGLPDTTLQAEKFAVGGPAEVAAALGPEQALAVMFRLAGGVNGRLWLVAPQTDMLTLAARLLGTPDNPPKKLDDPSRGALAEAGNVVASSFLNVFGDALREVCFPSVPDVRDAPSSLLSRLALDLTQAVGLIRVVGEVKPPLRSTLLWSPDPLSLEALVNAVHAANARGGAQAR
ncbi:MAG: hypothetical protein AB2A00_30630 [Myxococcota bacterium]